MKASVRFKHEPTYVVSNGQVKVYCACSWQAPKVGSVEAAEHLYTDHMAKVGIRDRPVK